MANVRFSPPNSWIIDCDCGASHTITCAGTTSGGSSDDGGDIDTGWGHGPRTHTVTVPTSGSLRDPSLLEDILTRLQREPEPSSTWQIRVVHGSIALPDLEGLVELQRRTGRDIVVSPGRDDESGAGNAGR